MKQTPEQAWDDFVKAWEKKHGRLYPVHRPAHAFPFETVETVEQVREYKRRGVNAARAFDEFMRKVLP